MSSTDARVLLRDAERRLADAGVATPRADAEILLAHSLGVQRSRLGVLVALGEAVQDEGAAAGVGDLPAGAAGVAAHRPAVDKTAHLQAFQHGGRVPSLDPGAVGDRRGALKVRGGGDGGQHPGALFG